jgi:hypothetical protein
MVSCIAVGAGGKKVENQPTLNLFSSFYMTGLIVSYFTTTIFYSMRFSLKRLMDIGMLETIWVCPISKVQLYQD